MAKTLTNLIADVRQHIAQPDASNSNFTDAQLTIWLNDAYRKVVTKLRHLPTKTRDYSVSAQQIDLNSATITVDHAKLMNPDSGNEYQLLKVISLEELLLMDADFENADADFPQYLVRNGTFTALLYPPPKASVIALTTPLRTHGLEMPTELSSGSDTPDVPENMQDFLANWAAYRCFSALENGAKATEHITLFNSGVKDQKGLATEFSMTKKRWVWTESE